MAGVKVDGQDQAAAGVCRTYDVGGSRWMGRLRWQASVAGLWA